MSFITDVVDKTTKEFNKLKSKFLSKENVKVDSNAPIVKGVIQSYGSDPLQTVTFYPSAIADSPLVIMVHGGGFRSSAGDAASLATKARSLCHANITVAVVNYRSDVTAPAFPDEVNDVVDGTNYAIAHAGNYNANGNYVAMIGGSSGGTLVSSSAVSLKNSVKLVIVLSGTEDLTAALAYWKSLRTQLAKLHVSNLTKAIGTQNADAVSPVNIVSYAANAKQQWYIYNGATEVQPVMQADSITSALKNAGVSVTENILPTSNHAFNYWPLIQTELITLIKTMQSS